MPSAIPGGNSKKGGFFLFFSILALLGSAQKGYMGKRNELGMDLFNATYQGVYELEYKGVVDKHLGLLLSFGYYASKKNYDGMELTHSDNEPLSSFTTGPTFGIGLGNNLSRLGMAYPIGYCMSYGYKASLLKIEDRYRDIDAPVHFERTVHELYVRFERNYNVYKGINLQLSVRCGTLLGMMEAGTGNPDEVGKEAPLRALPALHPFSKEGTRQFRLSSGDGFEFYPFIMPMIRVAYLF